MQVIDGKLVGQHLRNQITEETKELVEKTGKKPNLKVIIVGANPASQSYVNSKKKAALEVGFDSENIELPEEVTQEELLALIDKLNKDKDVNGILVQLPLPKHIDEQEVIKNIDISKDVDGFHPEQVGGLSIGLETLEPCTPAGMVELLKYYNIPIEGQNVVVIGRSNIVGKPIAALLLKEHATVTITHSKTKNLSDITKQADIVVVALGVPKFLKADMVKDGVVVLDVGINRVDGKIVGDVDYDEVSKKASYITPVPGGVGPMTITMLLFNTLKAFKMQNGLV